MRDFGRFGGFDGRHAPYIHVHLDYAYNKVRRAQGLFIVQTDTDLHLDEDGLGEEDLAGLVAEHLDLILRQLHLAFFVCFFRLFCACGE